MAEVTRADRLAAFRALYPLNDPLYAKTWIDTGDDYGLAAQNASVATAIADARSASSAEVTRLEAEVAELKSQANEYGRHPLPTVASAELEVPSVWLLSPVEFPRPLEPGDRITSDDCLVYEVRKLRSKSTPIAGEERDLFVALHDGPGSAVVFFRLDGDQREWVHDARIAAALGVKP